MKIPKAFESLLSGDYRAMVDSTASRFQKILKANKLEFFPDFTDHGIQHVEEVLETAASIIEPETFKYLNEKDISILIISIILHDVGMHISAEGVRKILGGDFDSFRISEFDKRSWKDEWDNFFQEAKRFNDEQLTNIFGTSDQVIVQPDLDNLDQYDRKLYGEFLRRFHHRLAHEIALGGFPTQIGNDNIKVHADDIDKEIVNLAGLIARSHGMPVRNAIDYLQEKYAPAWRSPYEVKAVFLMVVIRISDYLQIHSERASKILLQGKRFASPVSKREWEKHSVIKDISIKTDDPELVFVTATPETSLIYLELEKLFDDIQAELDISWAVLGEAYGRDNDFKNLKIRYRRIRSVLDDKEKFSKDINYVPERIFFNADPALLKLLIGPLYGEDPKYGVRELLQNSVDAVKEREYLAEHEGIITITLQPVKKDKKRYELIIHDTGLGMTKDTIIHYFFKAGASFRKSMAWRRNFMDDGEVKIQKTGRFGVGVLAVFLLGDEFELETCHMDSPGKGYQCKASLATGQVELVKKDLAIGTRITITLKDTANAIINSKMKEFEEFGLKQNHYDRHRPSALDWFTWYVMDSPEVVYKVDDSIVKAFHFRKDENLVSASPELPGKNWRAFRAEEYQSVHWTIDLKDRSDIYLDLDLQDEIEIRNESLICNGFKINRGYRIFTPSYNWRLPKISVFDNDGNLPLSLSRDYVQDDRLPFEAELLEHMSLYVLKALLKTEFNQVGSICFPVRNDLSLVGEFDLSEYVVVMDDEFTLLHPGIFNVLKISAFEQFWFKRSSSSAQKYYVPGKPYQAIPIRSDTINFYKWILEDSHYFGGRLNQWFTLGGDAQREDSLSRMFIPSAKFNYLKDGNRLSKSFRELIQHSHVTDSWVELKKPETIIPKLDMNFKGLDPQVHALILERTVRIKPDLDNFFMQTWKKYLGEEWTFPIEPSKRPKIKRHG